MTDGRPPVELRLGGRLFRAEQAHSFARANAIAEMRGKVLLAAVDLAHDAQGTADLEAQLRALARGAGRYTVPLLARLLREVRDGRLVEDPRWTHGMTQEDWDRAAFGATEEFLYNDCVAPAERLAMEEAAAVLLTGFFASAPPGETTTPNSSIPTAPPETDAPSPTSLPSASGADSSTNSPDMIPAGSPS